MKHKQQSIDLALKAAEEFYGSLEHPKVSNGGILSLYENFDKASIERFLMSVFSDVSEETDINDDRCVLFRVFSKEKSGFVFFSFIDSYVYIHNFPSVISEFEKNNYNIIDYETASFIVDANADFFSYESDVQIFNILFSNYMLDSLN